MMSDCLRKAREYEAEAGGRISPEERPRYHFSTRTGWLNDPNGFSFYQGKYHLFYQYYPYAVHWDSMHWGHAVSDDLMNWEYLPCAMAPDEDYDSFGVFSGSALTADDGKHLIMYTGVKPDGNGRTIQTQCIATGDGLNYEKYEGNPVIAEADMLEGDDPGDFRDPKFFRTKDGGFACVTACRAANGSGRLLLFVSPDAYHWTFKNVLYTNDYRFGDMLECPDFFPLGDKWVLITDAIGMRARGQDYHVGNGVIVFTGTFDEETGEFVEESDRPLDQGLDFYAPQSMEAPDGRRILIGWMQAPGGRDNQAAGGKWYGQMTVPRELSLKDGRVLQRPVREIEALRKEKTVYENLTVDGECHSEGLNGRISDMEITIRPGDSDRFEIVMCADEEHRTRLIYRPKEGTLTIDRNEAGSHADIIHERTVRLLHPEAESLSLRVLLDRFSIEVFVNDGEQVLSNTVYTPLSADGLYFISGGKSTADVVKYTL